MKVPSPHWHDFNPWRDQVVYVPVELLAHCCAGGSIDITTATGGKLTVPLDSKFVLRRWRQTTNKLDGYILQQPSGCHSIGVRYGKEASYYFSPHNANPELTQVLLEYYRERADVDG